MILVVLHLCWHLCIFPWSPVYFPWSPAYLPWSPAYFPWSPVYVSPAPDKLQSIMEDTQMSTKMEDLYNYKVGLGFYFCIIYECILVKRVATHLKHWFIICLQWRHGSAHLLHMKLFLVIPGFFLFFFLTFLFHFCHHLLTSKIGDIFYLFYHIFSYSTAIIC